MERAVELVARRAAARVRGARYPAQRCSAGASELVFVPHPELAACDTLASCQSPFLERVRAHWWISGTEAAREAGRAGQTLRLRAIFLCHLSLQEPLTGHL